MNAAVETHERAPVLPGFGRRCRLCFVVRPDASFFKTHGRTCARCRLARSNQLTKRWRKRADMAWMFIKTRCRRCGTRGHNSATCSKPNPPEAPSGPRGFVYFIEAEGLDRFKIGWATDPGLRLEALRIGSPVPLAVRGTMPGSVQTERRLHRQFASSRLGGEWFASTPELLEFVEQLPRDVAAP